MQVTAQGRHTIDCDFFCRNTRVDASVSSASFMTWKRIRDLCFDLYISCPDLSFLFVFLRSQALSLMVHDV